MGSSGDRFIDLFLQYTVGGWTVDWLNSCLRDWSLGLLNGRLIGQLIQWLIDDKSVDYSVGLLVDFVKKLTVYEVWSGWLVVWLIFYWWLFDCLFDWLVYWSVGLVVDLVKKLTVGERLISRIMGWLIGRSVNGLIDWLIDWFVDYFTDWLIYLLFGWLVGRLLVGWWTPSEPYILLISLGFSVRYMISVTSGLWGWLIDWLIDCLKVIVNKTTTSSADVKSAIFIPCIYVVITLFLAFLLDTVLFLSFPGCYLLNISCPPPARSDIQSLEFGVFLLCNLGLPCENCTDWTDRRFPVQFMI